MHEEMLHFVCLLFIFFFRTMTARMYISLDKTVVQYVIYLKMTVRLVFIHGVFSVIWRAGVSEKQRRKGSALRVWPALTLDVISNDLVSDCCKPFIEKCLNDAVRSIGFRLVKSFLFMVNSSYAADVMRHLNSAWVQKKAESAP